MKTQRRLFLCAIALLAAGTPNLLAAQKASQSHSTTGPLNDASLALRISTLGIGLEAGKLLIPHVGVRVGANFGSISRTSTRSDISYDASLKFKAVSALVDLYLKGRGAFHFTGGLVTNPLSITGTGVSSGGNYTINGNTYSAAEVGTLTATGKFAGVGPYLGLGFGTSAHSGGRIKILFDLGTVIGSAKLTLAATGPGNNQHNLASDLEAQRAKTQKDIDKIAKVYPVISFGVAYHF